MKQRRLIYATLALSILTPTLGGELSSPFNAPSTSASTQITQLSSNTPRTETLPVAPHVVTMEDMPSNHNSDPALVPQLRRSQGKVKISWAGIRDHVTTLAQSKNIAESRLDKLTATLIVNGVAVQENIPWNQTSAIYNEPQSGQMDYYIVYKENGLVVHTSKWAMRETSDGQNIAAGSFEGKFAGEAYGFELNEELKAQGFSEELSRTSVRLGNAKVVWVLNPTAEESVRNFIRTSADGVDVKPVIGANGEPTSVLIRDRKTHQTLNATKKDFHFKVDAAFNGNAFFWDDMLVALATTAYHPWLAKSTLEFWLQVQSQNGGVIPREVRKDSLISLWFAESVQFPEAPKANLSYTNPYLMNWVADKIYRFNPSAENLDFLKRASHSIDQYSDWMVKNRSIRDANGKVIGFNGSALGTGLDNSRSDVGNDNDEAGYKRGYVDFMAQHIAMLKDNARWSLIFARHSTSEKEKSAYVVKARESQKRALEFQKTLNEHYWNQERGFYFDISLEKNGRIVQDLSHTVISGFWAMYAMAPDRDKVARMVEMQLNPEAFGGEMPLPANALNSIREDHKVRYTPREQHLDEDGYWDKWAVWPSMAMAAIEGMRRVGRWALASKIAGAVNRMMAMSSTETVEEAYGRYYELNAEGKLVLKSRPLQHAQHPHRADFAGWGKGPGLENTLEDGVGLSPTYRRGMRWDLRTSLKVGVANDLLGVRNMSYAGGVISHLVLQRTGDMSYILRVKSEKPFELHLNTLIGADGQLTDDVQGRSPTIQIAGGNVEQEIRIELKSVNPKMDVRNLETAPRNSEARTCESLF